MVYHAWDCTHYAVIIRGSANIMQSVFASSNNSTKAGTSVTSVALDFPHGSAQGDSSASPTAVNTRSNSVKDDGKSSSLIHESNNVWCDDKHEFKSRSKPSLIRRIIRNVDWGVDWVGEFIQEWTPFLLVATNFIFSTCLYRICSGDTTK